MACIFDEVGTIDLWPSTTRPTGWLECNGATFSEAEYPELAKLLGSTTLPDYRGRVPYGYNGDDPMLSKIGNKLIMLSDNQVPLRGHTHTTNEHSHTQPAHTHTSAAHTHTSAAHTHPYPDTLWQDASGDRKISSGGEMWANTQATGRPSGSVTSTTPGASGTTTPGNSGSAGGDTTDSTTVTVNSTNQTATDFVDLRQESLVQVFMIKVVPPPNIFERTN